MIRPAIFCLFIIATSVNLSIAREWTDNTGMYKMEAELVKVDGESVVLKKEDGVEISVPINRLSEKDRADAAVQKLGGRVYFDMNEDLRVVSLSKSRVTDADLALLRGITSLKTLRLDETQVTDAGLAHLKALTNLTSLDFRKTKITDTGLEHLEGLTHLKELELDSIQVTDAGIKNLSALRARP